MRQTKHVIWSHFWLGKPWRRKEEEENEEEEEEEEGEGREEFQVCFGMNSSVFPWRLIPPFLGFN